MYGGDLRETDVKDLGPEGAGNTVNVCKNACAARTWICADVQKFPKSKSLMVVSEYYLAAVRINLPWGFPFSNSDQ